MERLIIFMEKVDIEQNWDSAFRQHLISAYLPKSISDNCADVSCL